MSGKSTELFLDLLRSGLWQTEPNADGFCDLTLKDWRELWLISRKQTVQGLVYFGINLLPKEYLPPIMTLASWMVEIERISQDYGKIQDTIDLQALLWQQSGIKAILLKGKTVADFYPEPSLRISGDIDWFFPEFKDWERANSIVEQRGCSLERDSDGDVHYLFNNVVIEHHQSANELSSPRNITYLREIQSFESKGLCFQLSPLPNLILLNTHILKHLMVSGIGLRQFCDLAMAYNDYFIKSDNQDLKAEYYTQIKKLGLLKWTNVVHQFLVNYLGYPEQNLPFPIKQKFDISWLLAEVLKDGNFGSQVSKSAFANKAVSKVFFSLRLAPKEYIYRIISLSIGRVKRIIH